MPRNALPCIVCGKQLENIDEGIENQPSEGLAFITHGHYGGTVFDPMDGQFLEINVCDPCLVKAGEKKQVLLNRDSRLVVTVDELPTIVGHQKVNREYVYWEKGKDNGPDTEVDCLHISPSEVGSNEFEDVTWNT